VQAGDNVGLLMRGLKREDVQRGQVVCKVGSVKTARRFEAEIYVLTKEEGGRHTAFFKNYRPQVSAALPAKAARPPPAGPRLARSQRCALCLELGPCWPPVMWPGLPALSAPAPCWWKLLGSGSILVATAWEVARKEMVVLYLKQGLCESLVQSQRRRVSGPRWGVLDVIACIPCTGLELRGTQVVRDWSSFKRGRWGWASVCRLCGHEGADTQPVVSLSGQAAPRSWPGSWCG
jgi:hypothetical protein